jgi:hypothetical protein
MPMEAPLDGSVTSVAYSRRAKYATTENIRDYNSAMKFASMGAGLKSPPGSGLCSFRIYGQVYHLVPPLYANEANKPGYGQIIHFHFF